MCGYYLAIGMTMAEYWDASPRLVQYYREAHKYRVQMRNQELWLQGLYNYNAFGTVLANAFGKKGGTKHQYLDKPIELFGKTEEEEQAEALKTRNSVVNMLNRMKLAFDAKQNPARGQDNGNRST